MRTIRNISYNRKVFRLLGVVLISTILFSGVYTGSVLASDPSYTATTDTSVTIRPACSMTARVESEDWHSAIMINGQYKDDIGLTTITTFCNNPNGYAIYAIGYTGGENGVTNNKNTVLHNSAMGDTYDILTGTNTSGDTSSWAMKLTALDGDYKPNILNGYNDYSVIPQNYTKVADYSSSTGLVTIGSSLTTTYAVHISNTQPAGTYEGQVKYVLVHPSTIEYPYVMQNVANWGSTVDAEGVVAIDARDGKTYHVAKLADGKLWMTQNLDFDIVAGTTYTNENTDIGWNADTSSYDSASWTPNESTFVRGERSWTDEKFAPESVDWGDLCWNGELDDDGSLDECNSTSNPHYHIGNYYNWTAAVAMDDSTDYTDGGSTQKVDQSICPAGWTLPKDDDGPGSFPYLGAKHSLYPGEDGNLQDYPVYFTYGGYYFNSTSPDNTISKYGRYWSSDYEQETVYGLSFSYGQRYLHYNLNRRIGGSVRCVAR